MASDADNKAWFDQTANDPALWRLRGLDLHTASRVLRERATDAVNTLDWLSHPSSEPGVQECRDYSGLAFQAAMLQGFAVECLLKCLWLVNGNSIATDGEYTFLNAKCDNHDLVRIAREVGLPLSPAEAMSVGKLSEFSRSFGRYPISKSWHRQPLVKSEFGIQSGPTWTTEDHALAEAVLARLRSAVDPSRMSE